MVRGVFGPRSPGVVSVVDAPLSRSYARNARIAFLTATPIIGVLTATVLPFVMPLLLALSLALPIGAVLGFVVAALVRIWPVVRVLWWWSTEIGVAAALLGMWWLLAHVSPWLAAAALSILGVTLGTFRRLRHRLVAWAWCVVVRHRLRLCFAEFIRSGSRSRQRPMVLPLIFWARPTPAGERVWVWLRPGLSLSDLEGGTGRMAVACWAGEVRVQRASTSYAALIRVDVTRRDPLVGLVVSPLAGRFRELETARSNPELPSYVTAALDLDGVPEPPAEDPRARR